MGTVVFSFFKESMLYLLCYIFLIVLIVTDIYIIRSNKKKFVNAILLCMLHLTLNYFSIWMGNNLDHVIIHALCSYTGYIVRPFILYYFTCLIFPESKHRILLGASYLNFLMYATTHFTHLCVYYIYNDYPRFHRGPLGYVIFIICGWTLGYIIINSIYLYYKKHIRRWILPPITSLFIIYAVYNDFINNDHEYPTDLNKALLLVIFLFYLFYHLQLAEQYEEKMLQNQQLQLMISQIKPHFFFNAITTIQELCYTEPEKAAKTLGLFATYVRQNIAPMNANLIPFSKELEHVKAYVGIEILRFPNIGIQYDLQVTDFNIAALSIEPLIENAIKHGIRSREHGVVVISTRKSKDFITITIKDNGIGFDPKKLQDLDETHVGINNVRNRLKLLQNAELEIASCEEGTTITISIPREY